MIVIRLMGGLGNQMFQYAFGRSLSLKYNKTLVLDKSLLEDKSENNEINTHRNFDLDIFDLKTYRWATKDEINLFNGNINNSVLKKITRKFNNIISPKKLIVQKNNNIDHTYFDFNKNVCYVGRWQSYIFFKEFESQIISDFKINKSKINSIIGLKDMELQILNSESICLHVRRADLITSSLYSKTIGVLDLDYYKTAISKFNDLIINPTYFIFSDDLEWCKKNISTNKKTIFVDATLSGEKSEGHFYLMTQCKHFIIANSTFAWWSAFISNNDKKQVIYPNNWYKDIALNNPKMCPPEWIAI